MTGTEIVRHNGSLQDKLTYAKALADSGLLPTAYRKQPANVLYAVEHGEMLGLPPLAAINGLHIIEGKPTASAGMVSALVRRAGHRLRSGYDGAKGVGWCEIVRHDDPDFTYRSEWTIDRAVRAGLVEHKNGRLWARDSKGKPRPWELYPEAMLKARAVTECARDACEEALNGVHYTPEELGADVDESGEPIRVTSERADQSPGGEPTPSADPVHSDPVDWDALIEQAAGDPDALRELWYRAGQAGHTELLQRIAEAGKATAGGEPVDAEIVDEASGGPATAEQPVTEMINKQQLTKLHTQLGELGITERPDKLTTVGLLAKRPGLASSKNLTMAEAHGVIDLLERLLADADPPKALDAVLGALQDADQQETG